MKTEIEYMYALLRYEHDIRTEEFLNVGVLFWAPEQRKLRFKYTESTSASFRNISGRNSFRSFRTGQGTRPSIRAIRRIKECVELGRPA
jgi:hypothetical protein